MTKLNWIPYSILFMIVMFITLFLAVMAVIGVFFIRVIGGALPI